MNKNTRKYDAIQEDYDVQFILRLCHVESALWQFLAVVCCIAVLISVSALILATVSGQTITTTLQNQETLTIQKHPFDTVSQQI